MNPNKQNARNVNKRRKDFTINLECRHCRFYQGHKRGCKLDSCRREDEKLQMITKGKTKRERRDKYWAM